MLACSRAIVGTIVDGGTAKLLGGWNKVSRLSLNFTGA
jgi:hypothetical protein